MFVNNSIFTNSSSSVKFETSQRVSRMTVHQKNDESHDTCFPVTSPVTKNQWPVMENDSSSWDRNSRATSSSWPCEMEEAATRKILQLWDTIERNIYGEDDDETSVDRPNEECNQWRSQLIHLRIVGKGASSLSRHETNETLRSSSRRSGAIEDRFGEEIIMEDSLYQTQDMSGSPRQTHLVEDRKEVFEQILEYVCTELAKQEEVKQEGGDSLGKDLDEILRITRAPTYSGRKWSKNRKKHNSTGSRKTSANDNRFDLDKSTEAHDENLEAKNRIQNDEGVEGEESAVPQVPRNKLGTVFNEKIVVSPVPFFVTTRESFTTLRTTPISFRTQNFEMTSQGLGRFMNSASKSNSAQGMSSLRIPQSHSAWQAHVCPTVWPKNISLAPIDPARLPSSKNRLSTDSLAGLPNRNRNSLSPISRPQKPVTSANRRNNSGEQDLEVLGKKIVTRLPKKHSLKTSWDGSPRSTKNSRTKPRSTKK